PIVCVSLEQAKAFSKWVGGRLPSQPEWEYAARSGGKDQKYPWGNEKLTCERAIVDDPGCEDSGDLAVCPDEKPEDHPFGLGNGCGSGSSWAVCSRPKGNTK